MALSEIAPSSPKIEKLINRIEEGDIKIPAFQRGLVWTQEQVIELIDSIYHDYPIGSILLWNSSEKLKSTRNIRGFLLPNREPEYPVNYVLDGQQRLSSIYAVFGKDKKEDPDSNQYKVDTTMFEIFFDLDTQQFLPKGDLIEDYINLIMSTLFNAQKLYNIIKNF